MDEDELIFEDLEPDGPFRVRVGKSKVTGIVHLETRTDASGREIEKLFFKDDGSLSKHIFYEYDEERKPRLTTAFDATGKLIFRQERGKRPEIFQ